MLTTAAGLRVHPSWDVETTTTVIALRSLARRFRVLTKEAAEHRKAILAIVCSWRPDLLEQLGVGPIVAATVLCAWSQPGRIQSEAAFAMLAGVAPIPANSGQVTNRYRLNRYGDLQLNRALHTVVPFRIRYHDPTRDYVARRTGEGKTGREIKRWLSRYIARDLYRLLESGPKHGLTDHRSVALCDRPACDLSACLDNGACGGRGGDSRSALVAGPVLTVIGTRRLTAGLGGWRADCRWSLHQRRETGRMR